MEQPTCVYLVYCDNLFTGLTDLPTLERIFLSQEKAEAYLAKNPRPGQIEKWFLEDFFEKNSENKRVSTINTKDTYDHEVLAKENEEIKERTKRLREADQKRKNQRIKHRTPNWT